MSTPGLRQLATRGIAWSLIGQLGTQFTRMVLLVVLARLLSPEDFGLVAMVTVVTGFASVFADAGFGAAIIHRPDLREAHKSAAFWVTLSAGLLLALLVAAASPLIAAFYGEPDLKSLVLASAPGFLFASLGTVPDALLRRSLRFRQVAVAQVASVAIGGTVGVVLAIMGGGPWSLIAMTLAASSSRTAALFLLNAEPIGTAWSRRAAADLWRYGRNVTGFGALNYWARQADDLLIGWRLGAAQLGIYGRAYTVMLFPVEQVGSILGSVMFPALSKIQHDLGRVREVYLGAVRQIAFLTFPAMAGLLLVADDFVATVFGSAWSAMVPVLRVFCLVGLVQSVSSTVGWLFQALDETKALLRWGIASSIVVVGAFIAGLPHGIVGVAVSYATATALLTPISVHIAGRKAKITTRSFAAAIAPVVGPTAAMAAILVGARSQLHAAAPAARLLALGVIGVIAYTFTARVLIPATVSNVHVVVRESWRSLFTIRGRGQRPLHPNRKPFNTAVVDLNLRIAGSLSYGGVVVDLGCGSAPYRDLILRTADRYIGIDWPGSGYDIGQADVIADLSCGVPLTSGSVDVVTAFQVLEHVPEPALFLSEAYRILRSEGTVHLTVPFMWGVHEAPHDYWRFTRFGLHQVLERVGFVDIDVQETSGFWFALAAKLNYATASWVPGRFHPVFGLVWRANTSIGALLDRLAPRPGETVSYRVSARKSPEASVGADAADGPSGHSPVDPS